MSEEQPEQQQQQRTPESTTNTTNTTNPLFQAFDEEATAALVTALTEFLRNPRGSGGAKHLKASDLPEFTGNSLDGGVAEAFLLKLADIFTISKTPDCDRVLVASLAFPTNSTAANWFIEARTNGEFCDEGCDAEPYSSDEKLVFSRFVAKFTERFATPLARRYKLEDTWDKFTQKGSVQKHYKAFLDLHKQLKHLQIHHQPDIIASKFLRSLKPELFHIICNKNKELPDFETVYKHALEAEYQLHPQSGRAPDLNALLGVPTLSSGNSNIDEGRGNKNQCKYWCAYHKANNTHSTENCSKIKELKAAGKWNPKSK